MVSSSSTLGDALIPVINRLQDIFSQVTVDLKLTLPQVAVVGSQSSGKSSVLESLVGRDFLPRGSDIVTRRPLVLQLVKTGPGTVAGAAAGPGAEKATEWGEFLHAPGKLFTDFNLIRQEIQAETDRVVGTNKNVSDKAIRLKIFSPHVLTMTLVDLPGMTKVPVGDQPSNIEARIREMVLAAITPPTVIILAVSAANADLANSDALQVARMADPDGCRTIGVLTKLDIMDRGTNASHILRGMHIPLRLGYVAVVNRSQEDINHATSIEAARRSEEQFFASRAEYREVASQCGVTNLARRLNALLADHIRSLLPSLRRGIADALEARAAELRALGEPLHPDSKSARGAYLLQLLCEYAERFAAMLEGRHQDLSSQRLTGGARIRAVFNEVFGRTLHSLAPVRDVSDEAILTIIKNSTGVAGNLLVAQEPFELLVRRSISALLPPALACKDTVYEELLHIAEQTCPAEVARFPALQRQLAGAVLAFIRGGAEPAERMIRSLLECEHDFINCDHPDFIGGRGAIRAVMQERSMRVARGKDGADAAIKDAQPPVPAQAAAVVARKSVPSMSEPKPGSTSGAAQGGLSHALAMGLKALPDGGSSHVSDELLTRTRRRSEGGFGGMHHSHTSDDVLTLGAGVSTSHMAGAPQPHALSTPQPHGAGGGGSWFSWFKAADKPLGSSAVGVASPTAGSQQQAGPGSSSGSFVPRTEQEEVEVEVIRRLVDSYFSIVRRNLADCVPKAIMHFMVNNTKRGLQQHLIQQLYKEELLDELLSEKEDLLAQRKAAMEAQAALQAAMTALDSLPGELGVATATGSSSTGGPPGSSTGSTSLLGGAMAPGMGISLPTFEPLGNGFGPGFGPGFGASPRVLDRHPSMLAAARIATVATASLTGINEHAVAAN